MGVAVGRGVGNATTVGGGGGVGDGCWAVYVANALETRKSTSSVEIPAQPAKSAVSTTPIASTVFNIALCS